MVTPLMLMLLLPACTSWRPVTVGPFALVTEERPRSVRITMNGGESVTLDSPAIVNDSIVGLTDSGVVRAASQDLSLLEVRRFSLGRTVAFVASNVAVVAGFIAVVIWIQPHYYGL